MLQVLGRATSLNVRKVLWVCHELEITYELQEWGSGHLAVDTPAFRALNPNALVPVLRDGAFILWESNTICRYLASTHERTDLLPVDARERARVEQWMDWQATELNDAWRYAFMGLVRSSPLHTDLAAIDTSVRSWNRCMAILEQQLQNTGAFAAGRRFTLADVVLGLATNRWLMTPMERPPLPAVAAYYERLSEHPGFLAYGRNGIP
jgi:glutathione S-transferase